MNVKKYFNFFIFLHSNKSCPNPIYYPTLFSTYQVHVCMQKYINFFNIKCLNKFYNVGNHGTSYP